MGTYSCYFGVVWHGMLVDCCEYLIGWDTDSEILLNAIRLYISYMDCKTFSDFMHCEAYLHQQDMHPDECAYSHSKNIRDFWHKCYSNSRKWFGSYLNPQTQSPLQFPFSGCLLVDMDHHCIYKCDRQLTAEELQHLTDIRQQVSSPVSRLAEQYPHPSLNRDMERLYVANYKKNNNHVILSNFEDYENGDFPYFAYLRNGCVIRLDNMDLSLVFNFYADLRQEMQDVCKQAASHR